MRQAELTAAKRNLKLSDDWVLLALSKDSLEGWEKWGFGIFKKMDFYDEVDSLLTALNRMDDSKFKAENERVAAKNKTKRLRVSDRTFRTVYDGLQRQGGIGALSFSESNDSPYWEMNVDAIIPGKMKEAIELVNRIVNTPMLNTKELLFIHDCAAQGINHHELRMILILMFLYLYYHLLIQITLLLNSMSIINWVTYKVQLIP